MAPRIQPRLLPVPVGIDLPSQEGRRTFQKSIISEHPGIDLIRCKSRSSSMTTLSNLPVELRDAVCEFVEKKDLHNVRYVSRAFGITAARFLFNRVYLSHHPRDIDAFERVTSHPKFREHAKELVFDISTFNPDLLDFDCFWNLIAQHPPSCLRYNPEHPGHIVDFEKSRQWYETATKECGGDDALITNRAMEAATDFFRWFEPLARQHIHNRRTNRAIHALRKALALGWKVDRIVVTSLPPDNEDRPDEPYLLPTRSWNTREWEKKMPDVAGLIPLQEVLPRVSWMTLDRETPEILELANSGNSLVEWTNRRTSWQEWRARLAAGQNMSCFHPKPLRSPFRELALILQTLEEAKRLKEVSEFSVIPGSRLHPDCCNCGEGMSSVIFLTNGLDMTRLKELSKNLKVLRLVPESMDPINGAWSHYPGLNEILRCGSSSLQELYLNFNHHQRMSSSGYLLRNLTFKQLRRLHLCDVQFTDLELFSFLLRNSHCLRTLILDHCFMAGDNFLVLDEDGNSRSAAWWGPVLDELRRRGCFQKMEVFINSVSQQHPRGDASLWLGGLLELEEGLARWKTWTAGGSRFPLQLVPGSEGGLTGGRIQAEYREWLRSA